MFTKQRLLNLTPVIEPYAGPEATRKAFWANAPSAKFHHLFLEDFCSRFFFFCFHVRHV